MSRWLVAGQADKVAARSAELYTHGVGVIAQVGVLNKEFDCKLTKSEVENLQKREVYQDVVSAFQRGLVKLHGNRLVKDFADRYPAAMKALDRLIKKDDFKAVITVLKKFGADDVQDQTQQQQTTGIQIAFPPGVAESFLANTKEADAKKV